MEHDGQAKTQFTRDEFYTLIWSKPATQVARELGCSDVTICEICKTHQIPKPRPGYWMQLQFGKAAVRTALSECDDPALQTLTFHRSPDKESTAEVPRPEPEFDPDIQKMLERAITLKPVVVNERLARPHPLVRITSERIRTDRKPFHEQTEFERNDRRARLDICVSKEQTTRALCIMDALIERVEEIGGSVEIRNHRRDERKKRTVVCFGGEEVQAIRIREKLRKVHIPPEKRTYSWNDHEFQHYGILVLDGGPSYFNEEFLRDTPTKQRLEEGLNDLIIRFVKKAGEMGIERRLAQEARKRQEEEDRIRREREEDLKNRREELAKRQKAEQSRVDELVRHARDWQQSQMMREYIAAQSKVLEAQIDNTTAKNDLAEYLAWANRQADRCDPLVPSPPSVLDEVIEAVTEGGGVG